MIFYNEIDEFAVRWLEELVRRELLPCGKIDSRSVTCLRGEDLRGAAQAHFFAGIGGWPLALQMAGWPATVPVWTGSCPCQPFSVAGSRKGKEDDRHLWPTWFRLIEECRPPVIFGEQVASPAGLEWLDAVFADLEGAGYACGAADLCAASVGAPHARQRLYFVAVADSEATGRSQDARHPGQRAERSEASGLEQQPGRGGVRGLDDAEEVGRGEGRTACSSARPSEELDRSGDSFWHPCDWLPCVDGRARPVEPGTFPLAHGVPGRMGQLCGYGNAIVPQVAAAFVRSVMGALEDLR